MLKKKVLLFVFAFMMMQDACLASGIWFYTDEQGADYYLQRVGYAKAWRCGYVEKIDDETSVDLIYQFFHYPEVPYHIFFGNDVMHPGDEIRKGYLRVDKDADLSAVALYECKAFWDKNLGD